MLSRSLVPCLLACAIFAAAAAESNAITDTESAIRAAKRYTRARCTETPCNYKAERDGPQWRVWVQLTRRASPKDKPQPYPGGTVVLYFDTNGNLLRRLEAD